MIARFCDKCKKPLPMESKEKEAIRVTIREGGYPSIFFADFCNECTTLFFEWLREV